MMDLILQCFFSHVKDPVVRMYDKPTTRHLFFHKKANFLGDFLRGCKNISSMYNNRIRSILAKICLINVLGLFGLFHFFWKNGFWI